MSRDPEPQPHMFQRVRFLLGQAGDEHEAEQSHLQSAADKLIQGCSLGDQLASKLNQSQTIGVHSMMVQGPRLGEHLSQNPLEKDRIRQKVFRWQHRAKDNAKPQNMTQKRLAELENAKHCLIDPVTDTYMCS